MESNKMKAMIRKNYGYSEVIQVLEINRPMPKKEELLIKVHATTVNRTDCAVLSGKPFIMRFYLGLFSPKSETTGTDFAGEVVTVGENVTDYKVGDRVFGLNETGISSHAEYIIVDKKQPMSIIPEGLSYIEAVTALEGMHYAYNFVNKVSIMPGDQVLINGASGAIGSALVQITKYLGALVTAVCESKHKDLMNSLGVDRMIDYQVEDFTKIEETYDFILDAVGKSTYGQCKSLLKDKGIYISSEPGNYAQNLILPLITPIFGGKKVIYPFPSDVQDSIDYIKTLIEEGHYKPIIDRIYSIDSIGEAYDYVFSGQKTGNVVLKMK